VTAADGRDQEAIYPDAAAGPGAPVDPPDRPVTIASIVERAEPRRPILPASLATAAQRRQLADWAVRYAGYRALYHLTRAPKYAGKVLIYAPLGAGRTVGKLLHWGLDLEGWGIRQDAATRNDIAGYLALARQRDRRVGWRAWVLGAVALVVLAAVIVLAFTPGLVQIAAAAAAVVLFARLGRPQERPILDRVGVAEQYRKLTAEMVRRAILATGKVKKAEDVKFLAGEIHRDGPGYLAVADLPDGVIALDIVDERPRLAGGFRLPVDQVWPDHQRGEHPSRLRIWVADRPVSAMRQPAWPLLEEGAVDYFAPFPYGVDVRMRPVSYRLDERNSLFGGIPGSGKSLAARLVLLGAVLDPLVIPLISELKGSGDYDMFEPLCPRGMYISGADEGAIERTVNIIDWLHHQCELRGPLVAKYARAGMNDTKKVNRRMAEHDERLRPVVAMFDEVQEFMASPFGIKGGGAATLLSTIKRARALGIHVIVATQRFDKDAMPKAISSLVALRCALAVPAQPETDMILGTSAYRMGARPTAFVPGEDSGWMVRAGFASGFETIRSAYVDDKAAERIVKRAIALRSGEVPDVDPVRVNARNLAEDVRLCWPEAEEGVWTELLLPRLQALRPELYGEWDKDALGAALRAAGIATGPIHRKIDGEGKTRHGVKRAALQAALDRRAVTGE